MSTHNPFKPKANDATSAVNANGNITGTHTDAQLFESVRAEAEARRAALYTGITCDACDKPEARASVTLIYDDTPIVRAALCGDCLTQAEAEKAASINFTLLTASQSEAIRKAEATAQSQPDALQAQENSIITNGGHAPGCLCRDCAYFSNHCATCGTQGDLLNGLCCDCHKNNESKAQGASETDAPRVDCELCDNEATLRRQFAGSMTNVCQSCADNIKAGTA